MSNIEKVLASHTIMEIIAGSNFKKITDLDRTSGFAGCTENAFIGEFEELTIVLDEDTVQIMDAEGDFETFSLTSE